MPRTSRKGRKQRWRAACDKASSALEQARSIEKTFNSAMDDMLELQGEYADRLDTLPVNLRHSRLARTLSDIKELPIENLRAAPSLFLDQMEQQVSQVVATPLPPAFGKN